MFTPWRFNIKEAARLGQNIIAIRFKPIMIVATELEQKYKEKYACLSADNCSARPYVRKAQYSFGWDWGPVLPTSGIWRKAAIIAYDTATMGYFAGLPEKVTADSAIIKLAAQIYCSEETTLTAIFSLAGFGQSIEQTVEAKVTKGRNFIESEFALKNPSLWWPNGYGKPNLYDACVKLFSQEKLLDEATIRVGIRSIELIQEPDDEGKTFIFRINGQNVFCKGANWIPADSFLPKVNYEQYNKLLQYAADANFNMIRVWGGGVYEADEFYDICDSLGIMIWQDFMYVCAATRKKIGSCAKQNEKPWKLFCD
jgi:beta-mannosidase